MDWTLRVFKRDLRCKAKERQVNEYRYNDWTREQMAAEVAMLRKDLYKVADGWRLEFNAAWTTVKNMMTGADVQIRSEDRGGVCDPSQERFWSM